MSTWDEFTEGAPRIAEIFVRRHSKTGNLCMLLLPPARRQARDLRAAFGSLTASPTIWRNLPPARVLIARGPT
jgi:hypothetical protein